MNYGLKEHGFSAHLMKLDGENLSLKLLLTQGTHATGWTDLDKLGSPGGVDGMSCCSLASSG